MLIMDQEYNFYSKGEELANAITHGVGTILAIVGTVFLLIMAISSGDYYRILGVSVYCFTLIILYLGSTLYHSLPGRVTKKVFRILDHASIYLLIAGTYTPIVLINMSTSKFSMGILLGVWILAIVGIVFKAFFVGKFEKLSTLLYIAMGWAVILNFKGVIAMVPPLVILFLVLGGLAYTLGCIFFTVDKIPFNHAIWHLFVLAGSALHFVSVLLSI